MIVCLCRGVSERTVRLTVLVGAESIQAVGDACGAGTGCGACHEEIARLVDEEKGSCRSAALDLRCQPVAPLAKTGTSG
jgi:bacterioferritin-associated ferredoxin